MIREEPGALHSMIGQMLILGFDGKSATINSDIATAIRYDNIGGVILFDYHCQHKTFNKNIESPKQVLHLNRHLQCYSTAANRDFSRANLPLFISVDYEGGHVNRLQPRYGFNECLSPQQVNNLSDSDAKKQAEAMATTLKKAEFNLNFAPSLDLNMNPNNPVIGALKRSYSRNPDDVIKQARIMANALKKQGILAAFKHFPGHGSSDSDSHLGFVDVTETWQQQELEPFKAIIQQEGLCQIPACRHRH